MFFEELPRLQKTQNIFHHGRGKRKERDKYLCNAEFLLSNITRHLYHLHAVTQGFRNGVQYVGCSDEQDL
jgi:hypothetical protein